MTYRVSQTTAIVLAVLIFMLTASIGNAYEDIGVSVTVKGKRSFKAKKQAKLLAGKQAIISYLKRVSPAAVGTSCAKQLVDDRAAFIKRVTSQGISQIGDSMEASYLIRIDDEKLNYTLEELGCGPQSGAAKVVILIMEEPPSKANISMILNPEDSSGVRKLRGLGPFVVFYTSYQRAIRDTIISKANQEGLKLTRLDTFNEFQKMRMSNDDPLVGVYFDGESEDFVINRRLLNIVRTKFAAQNTIILYYRIASLYFDQTTRELKAAIAISLYDLNSGETKSVGSQDFMVMVPEGQPSVAIRDGLTEVASSAASLLMNKAKKQIRRMASMAQVHAQKEKALPVTVSVHLNSKRTMYKVKKTLNPEMIQFSEIKSENLILKLAEGVPADDFVFGELLEVLEGMGIKIPEKNIHFNGQKVLIQQ
ncbi:hypothetical protein [Maridesulfovibrio ferrireducens]|uniref:hypothetical protein n=1 Tax=Maridesulfovibrio ferrireducens TaxID=246191 RepID=UPI001A21BB3C|nr:hypothetical protein [Maridesulfovibrio ferrireducens]MBI9113084.1 hypothetical protein [Maridesulfovibrio ferrireducens]